VDPSLRVTFSSRSCVSLLFLFVEVVAHSTPSLEQETDKATMDVEAQDEGVLGKIIVRF